MADLSKVLFLLLVLGVENSMMDDFVAVFGVDVSVLLTERGDALDGVLFCGDIKSKRNIFLLGPAKGVCMSIKLLRFISLSTLFGVRYTLAGESFEVEAMLAFSFPGVLGVIVLHNICVTRM